MASPPHAGAGGAGAVPGALPGRAAAPVIEAYPALRSAVYPAATACTSRGIALSRCAPSFAM
jgi:hypothetical protein